MSFDLNGARQKAVKSGLTPQKADEQIRNYLAKSGRSSAEVESIMSGRPLASTSQVVDQSIQSAGRAALNPLSASKENVVNPMFAMKKWQGLSPEAQNTAGFMALTTLLPELAPETMAGGILAKTALRSGLSAAGSAISDMGVGKKISKGGAALAAGGEVLGGTIEKGLDWASKSPLVEEMGNRFASLSKPTIEVAKKAGSKFKTRYPGTSEAITKGTEKISNILGDINRARTGAVKRTAQRSMSKYSQQIAERDAQISEALKAHEKVVNDMRESFQKSKEQAFDQATQKALDAHHQKIQGLSSELEKVSQDMVNKGNVLREARRSRGILVDPHQELMEAKIGPVSVGKKHEMGVHLPSRLPKDFNQLELEYRAIMSDKAPDLRRAVRLKQTFQDLKHVKGLGWQEDEAATSYLNHLDSYIRKVDPEYSMLEKDWSNSKKTYEKTYDRSKRVYDVLQSGGDVPIKSADLPKMSEVSDSVPRPEFPEAPAKPPMPTMEPMPDFPKSRLEREFPRTSPGGVEDTINMLMKSNEGGKARESREFLEQVPGYQDASRNVAARSFGKRVSSPMRYPLGLALGGTLGMGISNLIPSGPARGGLRGISAAALMSALGRVAISSPVLYREIMTNPEAMRMFSKVIANTAKTTGKAISQIHRKK